MGLTFWQWFQSRVEESVLYNMQCDLSDPSTYSYKGN